MTAVVVRGDADRLPRRYWRKVSKTSGCWIWGKPGDDGYGRMQIRWVRKRAHVWSWEEQNGPVSPGLQLDHICRNRACVRPDHLRLVTSAENTLAPGSEAIAKKHADRTHCPHGHPYDKANTRITGGKRRCRTCINAARRRKRAQ